MYFCAKLMIRNRVRYFIQLSYLGTRYHGWQVQPNALSVQQCINESLSTILRTSIQVVGAGRTDTGVHAKEMYAHFDVEAPVEEAQLTFKLNRLLPPDIAIQRIIKVADEAHARFDASTRSYEYHLTFAKNPFLQEMALLCVQDLDISRMEEATKVLFKHEDFSAFSRSHTQTKTNLCTIKEAYWEKVPNGLVFHISANRFLRNMVRAIVGTLLEVGKGKLTVAEFEQVILEQDRSKAGESAAAKGLFLTRVLYPNDILHVRSFR